MLSRQIPASPSPMPPRGTRCWSAGTGSGTRVDEAGQFPYRWLVRTGSQPHRIFRLARGGRDRSRAFRIVGAPERLATRRLVLGTTAFTNGLIGSSGRAGQKRALLELLNGLAPGYGDDWWFTAHHGMALSENGERDAARPKIDRSLAQNPNNPWAAHARAHFCYEEGDPNAARAFLTSWLTTYPRDGLLYSHLSWHLALGELEAGNAAAALRLLQGSLLP